VIFGQGPLECRERDSNPGVHQEPDLLISAAGRSSRSKLLGVLLLVMRLISLLVTGHVFLQWEYLQDAELPCRATGDVLAKYEDMREYIPSSTYQLKGHLLPTRILAHYTMTSFLSHWILGNRQVVTSATTRLNLLNFV